MWLAREFAERSSKRPNFQVILIEVWRGIGGTSSGREPKRIRRTLTSRVPIFVHSIANPAAATPSVEPDGATADRADASPVVSGRVGVVRAVRVRRGRPHGTDSERSGWDIESLLPLIMHGIDPLPYMWLPRHQKVPYISAFLFDDLTSRGSAKGRMDVHNSHERKLERFGRSIGLACAAVAT